MIFRLRATYSPTLSPFSSGDMLNSRSTMLPSRYDEEGKSSNVQPHIVMQILTIETTCDETAAAVVTDALEVRSSVVASQDELHERFAGVVPEIAARAHLERIVPTIDEALRRANVTLADLDAIAVAN